MPLDEYRRKRDFKTTHEPAGGGGVPGDRLSYVIQKHDASRLHWDFRVELGGVLLSWAVPKGPSYDTADKRLAMHVEDHPIEYGGFEGTIPKGEYGGGTVMLWDRGWWEPYEGTVKDAEKQFADGVLKMVLHGERLQGRWVLVRTHGYGGKGDSWLLIKEHDGGERGGADFDAIAEWTNSVASSRTMDEIAAGDDVWHSNKPSGRKQHAASGVAVIDPSKVEGAKRAKMPREQTVELATLVKSVPVDDVWFHEVKFDGYRILGFADTGVVRLVSRNGKDWTERFAPVAAAVADLLGDRSALLDGEVVVLKPDGTSSFQMLQNFAMRGSAAELHYYVFDLLHYDGWDLRDVRLVNRKRLLDALLGAGTGLVRGSAHVEGSGELFFGQACDLELEGVVSKMATSKYRGGRQRDWRKTKCLLSQEFVVIGYTDPGGARSGFGALVLGVYDNGKLVASGRVGTGFSDASLAEILAKLRPLERDTAPIEDPPKGAAARGIHWLEPKLVAEVAFAEWTDVGQLRHPSFLGMRDDKPAGEIVRERPAPLPPDPAPDKKARSTDDSSSATSRPTTIAGVKVTNPDRVLWPDIGVTKLEAMHYYESVAELMLPHVKERPLSLVRCPSGYTGECFYQKHITNFPKSVATVDIFDPDEESSVPYSRVTNLAGIVGLVQMGVLEIHPWGARADDTYRPDRLVFDLDPDTELPFTQVAATALLLRSELSRLGLESWLKSTGGKGLHVVLPITRTRSWDEVREFAHAFVDSIVSIEPSLFTANMSKAKRGGRIFIDYLRNARGATSIAPYSTRARPGAPVSVPLDWSEIEHTDRMPEFNVRTMGERIEDRGFRDPWADIGTQRQAITKAVLKRLGT